MMLCHALTLPQDDWIVDSGASSHMCNNRHLIQKFSTLSQGVKVTLGDGNVLRAAGQGTVNLRMRLPLRCTACREYYKAAEA